MKHLVLFTAIAASACTTDADDPDIADVQQGVHTVSGCDVDVDLSNQSTSETVGIHGARYDAYNCDKIYFHVRTGNRDWRVTATQVDDAGSDYTSCTHEHIRGFLERVAPSTYGNLGMTEDWGDPYSTGSYWPGTGFPIYACHAPSVARGLGNGQHYQFGVIAEGDQINSNGGFDTVYKNFNVTFSPL